MMEVPNEGSGRRNTAHSFPHGSKRYYSDIGECSVTRGAEGKAGEEGRCCVEGRVNEGFRR